MAKSGFQDAKGRTGHHPLSGVAPPVYPVYTPLKGDHGSLRTMAEQARGNSGMGASRNAI